MATRAGAHRGDQREAGRKLNAASGTQEGDDTCLQRLAQGGEGRASKVGKIIEEEHSAMGESGFARTRRCAVFLSPPLAVAGAGGPCVRPLSLGDFTGREITAKLAQPADAAPGESAVFRG